MKRKLLACLVFVGLAAGCVRQSIDEETLQSPGLTLSEARNYFESLPATRSDAPADEYNTLFPGGVSPDWQKGEIFGGATISSVRIPASNGYSYAVPVPDAEGGTTFLPLEAQLNVIRDQRDGGTYAYMTYYLKAIVWPTPEKENTLNHNFSGLAFMTTLSGFPIAVAYYIDGVVIEYASLGDGNHTPEQNWELMRRIGRGQKVCRFSAATRGVNDMNQIEIVVCIGQPLQPIWPKLEIDFDKLIQSINTNIEQYRPSGGGGGGAPGIGFEAPSKEKKPFPPNPLITTEEEQILAKLDSLNLDCMGRKLLASIQSQVMISLVPGSGSSYIQRQIGSEFTHTILLGENNSIVALFEELIHVYQNRNTTLRDNDHRLNDEIEAKLGWCLYALSKGEPLDAYRGFLGFRDGVDLFSNLCDMNGIGKSGFDYNDAWFFSNYEGLRQMFQRSSSPYANQSLYPYSSNHMHLKNLEDLREDC